MRSHKKPALQSGDEPSSLDAQNTFAYWPPHNSPDERNVRSLIKRCSEPNIETWVQLPGKLRGVYDSLVEAEEALERICGESVTESEAEILAGVGEDAAQRNSNLVVQDSVSQSQSVSVKMQPSSARRKLHTGTSACSADKTVCSKNNPTCAKMSSGVTVVKSVVEKPIQSTVPQPGLQRNNAPAVKVPAGTVGEPSTTSVVQPAMQSNSSQSAFGPDLSTSTIPLNLQSCASVQSTTTDQSVHAQNVSDARRKLIDLCASTADVPPAVPKLCGKQLTEHSGDASVGSDGVMDALRVINSNITTYMVGY